MYTNGPQPLLPFIRLQFRSNRSFPVTTFQQATCWLFLTCPSPYLIRRHKLRSHLTTVSFHLSHTFIELYNPPLFPTDTLPLYLLLSRLDTSQLNSNHQTTPKSWLQNKNRPPKTLPHQSTSSACASSPTASSPNSQKAPSKTPKNVQKSLSTAQNST